MPNLDICTIRKCHSIEEWIPKTRIRMAGSLGSRMSLLGIMFANIKPQSPDPGKAFAAKIGDWGALAMTMGKVDLDINIRTKSLY